MPETGTFGLMSGERKRSIAEWPKLPRPLLELYLNGHSLRRKFLPAVGVTADNRLSL